MAGVKRASIAIYGAILFVLAGCANAPNLNASNAKSSAVESSADSHSQQVSSQSASDDSAKDEDAQQSPRIEASYPAYAAKASTNALDALNAPIALAEISPHRLPPSPEFVLTSSADTHLIIADEDFQLTRGEDGVRISNARFDEVLTEAITEGAFTYYDPVRTDDRIYFTLTAVSLNGIDVVADFWHASHKQDRYLFAQNSLEGALAQALPEALWSYRGKYVALPGPFTDRDRNYDIDIHMEVDFPAGTIKGFDIHQYDIIEIDGVVEGNLIHGRIYGPQGTMEFDGGVFGSNAHEVAASFQNGNIVGVIYGVYDPARTAVIQ